MKVGLVLEGGAMRGLYTAGVLDILMENQIEVDGVIGVSAGAAFGCNYKSRQIGRVLRYNTKYCNDPRYSGLRLLLTTGDLYGKDFCYKEIPERLDVFDAETFKKNPVEFYVVCTDVHTGEPIYKQLCKGDAEDIEWMRASASMPLVSNVVSVGGRDMLDGAVSDSIPVEWFINQGFEKNIVVLTQQDGYRKKKLPRALKFLLHKYPAIAHGMINRYKHYNAALEKLKLLEAEGRVVILRPTAPLGVDKVEKNPDKLRHAYEIGRKDALEKLEQIRSFLK